MALTSAPEARAPLAATPVGQVEEHAFRVGSSLEVQGLRLGAAGTRRAACYRDDAEGRVIGLRFQVERLELAGLKPAVEREVRAGLAAPGEVLLQLDPIGRITGLALLDPPASPLVRDQLRSWATYSHFVQGEGLSWTDRGWDALGEVEDRYERRGAELTRTRRLLRRDALAPRLSGQLRARWGEEGALEALVGSETIELVLGGEQPSALTRETWLELRARSAMTSGALGAAQARLREVAWERHLVCEVDDAPRPGRPLAEHLPTLREGKVSLRELARTLRTQPGAVPAALRALRAGGFNAEGQRRLLAGLGQAETLEAQRALLSLARGELADELIATALSALGQQSFPLAETIEFLAEQSRLDAAEQPERQRWGTLGLGLVARHANEEDAANTAAILLSENLDAEAPRDQRLVILSALGNGGRELSFEAIAAHTEEGDAELRGRALFALRHVDVEEAQLLLTSGALEDPEPLVRTEAVQGLALRGPTPETLATLRAVLRRDQREQVRLAAVDGLSAWLTQRTGELDPETEQALRESLAEAGGDPSEAVRTAAAEGLRG